MILLTAVLAIPAHATEYIAPEAPPSVASLLPKEADSFMEGLWNVIQYMADSIAPAFAAASKGCLEVTAVTILSGIVSGFVSSGRSFTVRLISVIAISGVLLSQTTAFLALGQETVTSLSEYCKLFLPVITAALAANGGTGTATALYAETAFFDAFLCSSVSNVLLPLVRLFLCFCIASAATGELLLGKAKEFTLWIMTWFLKITLYVFTGFLSITGVIAGNVDALSLKAAKITISGSVPVVGSILSDASETILSGFSLMKNSAGIYGLLTFIALCAMPFIKIGTQYLLLKATAAIAAAFDAGPGAKVISDFSSAMGLILGIVAAQSAMLIVSTVCFMKGVQ